MERQTQKQMLRELAKLRGKQVKIVYWETNPDRVYSSEGILQHMTQSFACVKGNRGLLHFIAANRIVRLSERFSDSEGE